MKKYSSLVKKIEIFEKLARYGSRRAFLHSMATDVDKDKAKALVNQVKAICSRANITDETIMNGLGNVSLFGKTDPKSLRQAAESARYAMSKIPILAYPEADKDFNSLMTISNQLNAMANAQEASKVLDLGRDDSSAPKEISFMPSGNAYKGKVDVITGYPPIDETIQYGLSRILDIDGLGPSLDIDGKLGPNTRTALNKFKRKHLTPGASDSDAFKKIRELLETPKYSDT